MSNLKVVVVCVLFAVSYSGGYRMSQISGLHDLEINSSSDEEHDLNDEELIYQTALASLTNNGADLTRVTLFCYKHALAVAHYVDDFQENCESLKVVVAGVIGSGYSRIHDVEKVTPEPKSDPNIRKEDDYRVAVITLCRAVNETKIFPLEMPFPELGEDVVEHEIRIVGWNADKERRNDLFQDVYTIREERIYATFPNCASEINDEYIGAFMRFRSQLLGIALSVRINRDNSVKVSFIAIEPKTTFINNV